MNTMAKTVQLNTGRLDGVAIAGDDITHASYVLGINFYVNMSLGEGRIEGFSDKHCDTTIKGNVMHINCSSPTASGTLIMNSVSHKVSYTSKSAVTNLLPERIIFMHSINQ